MRFGKGLGSRATQVLLFLAGKPTCIRNPRKFQAPQIFLHLYNAKSTAALKLLYIHTVRLNLLADIQQARKYKAEHSCFTQE